MSGTPTVSSNGLQAEIYLWICSLLIKIIWVFSRYYLATSAKSFASCTITWFLPWQEVLILTNDFAFLWEVAENSQVNNFWYFSENLLILWKPFDITNWYYWNFSAFEIQVLSTFAIKCWGRFRIFQFTKLVLLFLPILYFLLIYNTLRQEKQKTIFLLLITLF